MFEELIFVLVAVIVVLVIFAYSYFRSSRTAEELNSKIIDARGRLSIAERKFMQGKIKRGIFDSLSSQIEEELLSAELALFRIQKAPTIEPSPKAGKIFAVLERPTNYRRAKINSILKETELLRHEMSLLEGKLLKRAIRESVFEKLIAQKESALISKEKELADIVESASSAKKF